MNALSKPLWVTAWGQSDVGLVRQNNEDSFLIVDLTTGIAIPENDDVHHVMGENGGLFLVADGMGGGAAGEIASRMAVEFVAQNLLDSLRVEQSMEQRNFSRIFKASIEDANRSVFQEGQRDPNLKGMGTTLTAAAVFDTTLFFAQLGDSRAYLIRNGSITQMTQDQSLVAQLVASGALGPEEAKKHPQRNVILQALGLENEVNVVMSYQNLKRHDRVVLCSDGLSGKVEAEEVNEVLHKWARPKDACQRLIDLARERGGEDNITVIVASFDGEGLLVPDLEDVPVYHKFVKDQRRRFWLWGRRQ
jgi:serine/threonine protein phosphatase PrpC